MTDASHDEEEWKDDDFLSFEDAGKDETESASAVDSALQATRWGPRPPQPVRPPWMDPSVDYSNHVHPLTVLHNEIVGFQNLMEPLDDEIRQREELIERVKTLVADTFGEQAHVHVFGSQATGLFLPSSDVDLVVSLDNEDGKDEDGEVDDNAKEDSYTLGSPLDRLAAALQTQWRDDLTYLQVIANTRVPLVKFVVHDIQVDICFEQTTGPAAAQLMKQFLDALPPLRPLTFVLKYFLAARGLNEPYSGGVGSYLLQLMIVSFLQHRERDAVNFRRPALNCLGAMLLEFLELYGLDFNYYTTGISVRSDGFYFPKGAAERKEIVWNPSRPSLLAVENPLDTTMDVGKPSFRIGMVQRAFAVAYKMLLAHIAAPTLAPPLGSILATILPVTDEMRQRGAMRQRLQSAERRPQKQQKTSR